MEVKVKEKKTLVQIGNVRVIENDDRNVTVERLEETINNKTKEQSSSWKFKGYSQTILGALRLIINKELLIDRNSLTGLEDYVEKVEHSNEIVVSEINSKRIEVNGFGKQDEVSKLDSGR